MQVVPPVFASCTRLLDPKEEEAARDAYWAVVTEAAPREQWLPMLEQACASNPDIAEPHATAAQILLQDGRWEEAAEEALKALEIFYQWGTM